MSDSDIIKRCRITAQGLVQGVGFRWQIKEKATELGLVGWVKNESDVTLLTIEIEGKDRLVEDFIVWLKSNPGRARVERITVAPLNPRREQGFKIKSQKFFLL